MTHPTQKTTTAANAAVPVTTNNPATDNAGMLPLPEEPVPWLCAATAGFVISIIVFVLLVIALGTSTVMIANYGSSRVYNVKITYYDVTWKERRSGGPWVEFHGHTLDSVTCGKASVIEAGGAFHYLAMLATIPMIIFFWLDRQPKTANTMLTHLPLVCLVTVSACLIIMNIALGDARNHANKKNCDTVPSGLRRYGMAVCWITAIIAQATLGIFTIVYLSVRYGKCCCYKDPRQQQQPAYPFPPQGYPQGYTQQPYPQAGFQQHPPHQVMVGGQPMQVVLVASPLQGHPSPGQPGYPYPPVHMQQQQLQTHFVMVGSPVHANPGQPVYGIQQPTVQMHVQQPPPQQEIQLHQEQQQQAQMQQEPVAQPAKAAAPY